MGILDIFKKSRKDVARTQNNLTVSQQNLSKADEILQQAKEEDRKLKDRFVGKLFRGKLIEDAYVLSNFDVIRVHCRVLSFKEYLTNDYEELVKDDAWLSGPFGVYGGVADRKEWKTFMIGVSAYGGDAREYAERHNGVVRSRLARETERIVVNSRTFTMDEQQVLKKILTDELGMDEKYFYPKHENYPSMDLLKEACDKVVDLIIVEGNKLAVDNKRWYHFFEEGSEDAFVDKILPVADAVVDELVKVKELEK